MNSSKWVGAGLLVVFVSALAAQAQLAPGVGVAPNTQFSGAFAKLFGEHKAFTADMETHMTQEGGKEALSTPGKIAYLDGKSRLEIDLSKAKGDQLPPGMAEQLNTMGMGQMTMISEEGKTNSYLVYPALKAYATLPTPDAKEANDSKVKLESTELGKDTVEGQSCIKNKVTITEADGTKSEATVWNATELKKFPVRIETSKDQHTVRMSFKNVKLVKPDAKLFDPPATFKKYD